MTQSGQASALAAHLQTWGLRAVEREADYEQWQRDQIPVADLVQLQQLAARRSHNPNDAAADEAFYDFVAQPHIAPVLYSQRWAYYLTVGAAINERLGSARTILDVGCGLGILTSWYAQQHPEATVVGIDRSTTSIDQARERAVAMGMQNCSFVCLDLDADDAGASLQRLGAFDVIVATHALLQSEQDPGLPSASWQTHERPQDPAAQLSFEQRTGLDRRLDRLIAALAPQGRLLLCEKTHHLGRRVPFQRALAARGLALTVQPTAIEYVSIEEPIQDGPLYVLSTNADSPVRWSEQPETTDEEGVAVHVGPVAASLYERLALRIVLAQENLYRPEVGPCQMERGRSGLFTYTAVTPVDPKNPAPGTIAALMIGIAPKGSQGEAPAAADPQPIQPSDDQTPLYENHSHAAQWAYEQLPNRRTYDAVDRAESDGRQFHIEWGQAGRYAYVYCANTFDQRQLVIVEEARQTIVEDYYRDLIGETPSPAIA